MKKVCHFSSVHRTNDIRVFTKECTTLAEAGYQTVLIACHSTVDGGKVVVRNVPEEGGRLSRILLRAHRVYRMAYEERADFYHFHDPELLPYGLLLKLRTRAKVIYDSHECYPEDLLNKEWLPKWLRYPLAKSFERFENFVARRLDVVVAATPHIARRFKGIAKRVVTVNNFPRAEEFSGCEYSEPAKRDGVCYVGAISFIRGIIPFLDALDDVPVEVKVYIAGSFASRDVELAAIGHRNWGRVTFYGQVDRLTILEIYGSSFAGIVNFLPAPNHEYSQPNKLFEYMAAGIPVVASNFQLWRNMILPTKCGFVIDPGSPKKIAEAINLLFNNPRLVADMAENCKEAISSRFSWNHETQELLKLYREI